MIQKKTYVWLWLLMLASFKCSLQKGNELKTSFKSLTFGVVIANLPYQVSSYDVLKSKRQLTQNATNTNQTINQDENYNKDQDYLHFYSVFIILYFLIYIVVYLI